MNKIKVTREQQTQISNLMERMAIFGTMQILMDDMSDKSPEEYELADSIDNFADSNMNLMRDMFEVVEDE